MCGRFTLSTASEILAAMFRLRGLPEGLAPRYNVAPSQSVLVLAADAGGVAEWMPWGLPAPWRESGARRGRPQLLINARSESVQRKRVFQSLLAEGRCLVLADGFYEWTRRAGRAQPWLFRLAGGAPFGLAGLWRPALGPAAGSARGTCVVLTTQANAVVSPVHHRMPVVVEASAAGAWLEGGAHAVPQALEVLRPLPANQLVAHPVSTRVNSAAVDDPRCVLPAPLPTAGSAEAREAPAVPVQLDLWAR